jgi:Flp pilus assembly protein TadG
VSVPALSRIGRRLRAAGVAWRARRASEAGYVAVLVAIIVPTVGIGLAAVAVDTATWYTEMQLVQKAADAAALAGVPYLPQDLPSARSRAIDVAARNGFPNSGSSSVTVGLGEKPTQLKVTISFRMKNTFGAVIGVPTQTITQSATADYQGPAPMGSPCNTFGNEPNAGTGGSSATPSGSAQSATVSAYCSRTPTLWGTVEGPETGKLQGDRYQTKDCESSSVDGCTSSSNDEYDDFGYTFVVRVGTAAVGKSVDLQLYDPMFVNTAQDCALLPDVSSFGTTGNANPYVTNAEARARYVNGDTLSGGSASADSFCTGDSYAGNGSGSSTPHDLTTSFVLRQQTDSQNPRLAPVQNDNSSTPCIKQYGSYTTSKSWYSGFNSISANLFKSGASGYDRDIAQTFHNWSSFCQFTPARAGDYYLQVRTNVSMGGTTVTGGTGEIKYGNTDAAADTGNTTSGEGTNSFSIRAVTQSGYEKDVSVSGYNHMPIYINADTATATFHLIRVLPGAAGQKISFSYFDAGDSATGTGSVKVLVPTDATGTITTNPFPGSCSAIGGSAGSSATTLTNCTAPFEASGSTSKNNGKTETITIPIPADYNCSYNLSSGCWYKVTMAFGTGQVHDVTTWDATVVGDPVRLVK